MARQAAELLVEAERAGMTDIERQAADSVIDLDADEATCPACMGTIPRGSVMCPDCGLRIG